MIPTKSQEHEVVNKTDGLEVLPLKQMKCLKEVERTDDVESGVEHQSVRMASKPYDRFLIPAETIIARVMNNTVFISNGLKFSQNGMTLRNGRVARVKSNPDVSSNALHVIGRWKSSPCLSSKSLQTIKHHPVPVAVNEKLMNESPNPNNSSHDNQQHRIISDHQLAVGTEEQLQPIVETVSLFPRSTEIVTDLKASTPVMSTRSGIQNTDRISKSEQIVTIDLKSEGVASSNKDGESLPNKARDNVTEPLSEKENLMNETHPTEIIDTQIDALGGVNLRHENYSNDPLSAAISFEVVTSENVFPTPQRESIDNRNQIVVAKEASDAISTDGPSIVEGMLVPHDNQSEAINTEHDTKLTYCKDNLIVGATHDREPALQSISSSDVVNIVEYEATTSESIESKTSNLDDRAPEENQIPLSDEKDDKPNSDAIGREYLMLAAVSTVNEEDKPVVFEENTKDASELFQNGNSNEVTGTTSQVTGTTSQVTGTTSQLVQPATLIENRREEASVLPVLVTSQNDSERNQTFVAGIIELPMYPRSLHCGGISDRIAPFNAKTITTTKSNLLPVRSNEVLHERKKRKYDETICTITGLRSGAAVTDKKSIFNKASTVLDEELTEERNLSLESHSGKVNTVFDRELSSDGFHFSIDESEGKDRHKVRLINSTCCRQLLNNDELISRLSDKVLEKLTTQIHRCGPNCKSPCGGLNSYLTAKKDNKQNWE